MYLGLEATAPDVDLRKTLAQFTSRKDSQDLSLLENYVVTHPASPWRASIELNLSIQYYRSGYFSRAFGVRKSAWSLSQHAIDRRQKSVANHAFGELIRMHAFYGGFYTSLRWPHDKTLTG